MLLHTKLKIKKYPRKMHKQPSNSTYVIKTATQVPRMVANVTCFTSNWETIKLAEFSIMMYNFKYIPASKQQY